MKKKELKRALRTANKVIEKQERVIEKQASLLEDAMKTITEKDEMIDALEAAKVEAKQA